MPTGRHAVSHIQLASLFRMKYNQEKLRIHEGEMMSLFFLSGCATAPLGPTVQVILLRENTKNVQRFL